MAGDGHAGHEYLEVWPKALELARLTRQLAAALPRDERDIKDQMRRAATSVCLNISEGNGFSSRQQYAHYIGSSRASVNEIRAAIELCLTLQLLSLRAASNALKLADEVSAMLWTMRKRLLGE